MTNHQTKSWIINAMVAALYIVLSLLVGILNLASGAIQFRISEGLNHLVVFNKKYIWGITAGVLLFNAFGPGNSIPNVIFGTGQTLLALLVVGYVSPRLPKMWQKMALNTVLFTVSMCLVALELKLTLNLPFWWTYFTTAVSELIIMTITAPIMYYLDKVVHFNQRIEEK
ncbi:QueT transporter family protein [Pediococcus parvulus]|jgi:uncharacterized membrane protein|uniref:QueT transporter family protein n=1 Tax=Pediococcus parvulus TaxID=54062 RepID=UPI003757D17F